MAIKSSGSSLAFSEIEDEFGQNGERSLGDYRISKTIGELASMPLDNGIPQSGQIKFSDFYTKKLNIVVDCHSGDTEARKNAKTDKWNNNEYDMVTNWSVAKPSNTSGKKIIIHVDKIFQSNAGNAPTDCALRTGTWNSVLHFRLILEEKEDVMVQEEKVVMVLMEEVITDQSLIVLVMDKMVVVHWVLNIVEQL